MNKSTVRIIFFLALISFVFTSCASNFNTKSSTYYEQNSNDNTPAQFVEIDITPINLGAVYFPMIQTVSGGTVYFTGIRENFTPVAMKMSSDYTWERIENSAAKLLFETSNADARILFAITSDESWWATWVDKQGVPHLYKIEKNGNYEELEVELFKTIVNTNAQFSIDEIQINKSDELCIATTINYKTTWIIIDTKEFNERIINPKENSAFILDDENLWGIEKNYNLTKYDLATDDKTQAGAIPITLKPTNNIINFCKGINNSISYITSNGIYRYDINTNVEQIITQKPSYAFAHGNYQGGSFVAIDNENYVLSFNASSETKIVRYVFDKDMIYSNNVQNEITNLNIWALESSAMLKSTIYEFAKQNPEVQINLQIGREFDSTLTEDDIIKNLNTQMLTGNPPDLLILDGLPIEQYIKSDIFLDLNGIINESEFYDKILNCYKRDGKVFAYPTLFEMPSFFYLTNVVEDVSFNEMADLYSQKNNVYFESYYDMFEKMYIVESPVIFPSGIEIDETALQNFLIKTKNIVTANGLSAKEQGEFGAIGSRKGGLSSNGAFAFMSGKYPTALEICQGMTIPWTSINLLGSSCNISTINSGVFSPVLVSSIPVEAENIENAKKFIVCLLTDKNALANGYGEGFSVNKKADITLFSQNEGDKQKDSILYPWESLFSKLQICSIKSSKLKEIVLAAATKYYDNESSLDATVQEIIQATNLYFKELK